MQVVLVLLVTVVTVEVVIVRRTTRIPPLEKRPLLKLMMVLRLKQRSLQGALKAPRRHRVVPRLVGERIRPREVPLVPWQLLTLLNKRTRR